MRLNRDAAALLAIFIILTSLCVLLLAFVSTVQNEVKAAGAALRNMQAFYIAEAGLAKARWELTEGGETPGWGESDISFGEGTYTVTTVDNGDDTVTITSQGYIPNDTDPVARRKVVEKNVAFSAGGAGTNLSLGKTATASSTSGANTPDKAIDGVSTTKWKSAINGASWLKLNYGSAITFDKIIFTSTSRQIVTFSLEYSQNDVTYQAVSNPVESPAGTVTFNSVNARYLRFNVTGNRPEVNEFETYNTAAGTTTLGQGEFVTSW